MGENRGISGAAERSAAIEFGDTVGRDQIWLSVVIVRVIAKDAAAAARRDDRAVNDKQHEVCGRYVCGLDSAFEEGVNEADVGEVEHALAVKCARGVVAAGGNGGAIAINKIHSPDLRSSGRSKG